MLNKLNNQIPGEIVSLQKIAGELSFLMPKFFKHMYPFMFKSIDIPPSQVFALMTLEEEKVCTLSMLSKILNVSPPTTSGLIDRLVKRGYVKRSRDKKDRRVVNISLTKSGDVIIKRFRKNVSKKWQSILIKFTPNERMAPLIFIKRLLSEVEKNEKTN